MTSRSSRSCSSAMPARSRATSTRTSCCAASDPARRDEAVAAVERAAAKVQEQVKGHASADFPAHWEAYQAAYGAVLEGGDLAAAERAYPAAEKAYAAVDADLAKRARAEEADALALDEQITDDFHFRPTMTLDRAVPGADRRAPRSRLQSRAGSSRGVDQLITRFRSLDEHDLTSLCGGLGAFADGDLTRTVSRVTTPIEVDGTTSSAASETFNAMLVKTDRRRHLQRDARRSSATSIGQVTRGRHRLGRVGADGADLRGDRPRRRRDRPARRRRRPGRRAQVRMVESARSAVQEAARAAGAQRRHARGRPRRPPTRPARSPRTGVDAAASATEAMRQVAESSAQVDAAIRGAVRALRADRRHRRHDHRHRRADQPAGAQRGHRGRPRRRAGPGFAVVAEEVRKLAEESQAAAARDLRPDRGDPARDPAGRRRRRRGHAPHRRGRRDRRADARGVRADRRRRRADDRAASARSPRRRSRSRPRPAAPRATSTRSPPSPSSPRPRPSRSRPPPSRPAPRRRRSPPPRSSWRPPPRSSTRS